MRVTTYNVNGLRARLEHVLRFAREQQPDVLCLQEIKLATELFPHEPLAEHFPHRAVFGQKGYNGVALLSKRPLEDLQRGFAQSPDPDARIIAATVGGLRLYDLYVPNGGSVGSERFREKIVWYGTLSDEIARCSEGGREVLVVGDMNVAPDDRDVWDVAATKNTLLCHPDERAAFASLLAKAGLHDALRTLRPEEKVFSWWDYRERGFLRDRGLRIDHTLPSTALLPRVRTVTVHRDVRGWDSPSDHAPVSIDLD